MYIIVVVVVVVLVAVPVAVDVGVVVAGGGRSVLVVFCHFCCFCMIVGNRYAPLSNPRDTHEPI